MRSKTIRAVTFDVGGTLIEPWPSVGHVYAEAASKFGINASPEHLSREFASAWKRRRNFDYSRAAWKRLVDETFAGLAAAAPSEDCFDAIYESFGRARAWRVFDDVWPVLLNLRRRGLKLGVISNWDERLAPLLEELRLRDEFEVVVSSNEAGHTKPSPEIFRSAARHLHLSPEQILHVGDSLAEDVAGARAVGMPSLLLDRVCGKAGEEVIPTLEGVLSALGTAVAEDHSD